MGDAGLGSILLPRYAGPLILEALCSRRVHMAGLRLLAPHLTPENQERLGADDDAEK